MKYPIDAWKTPVQAGLVIIAITFLLAFFDPFSWGWTDQVGSLRGEAIKWVTLISVVVFFLSALNLTGLKPSRLPATWGACAYKFLILTITLWLILSTIRSGMGTITDSLLSSQLFLSGASIVVLRNSRGGVSPLEYAPANYVIGFIVFCGALFLMWADTEHWSLVAQERTRIAGIPAREAEELISRAKDAVPGWRILNATLICSWLAGGLIAFTYPKLLGRISLAGIILIIAAFALMECTGTPQ